MKLFFVFQNYTRGTHENVIPSKLLQWNIMCYRPFVHLVLSLSLLYAFQNSHSRHPIPTIKESTVDRENRSILGKFVR